MPTLTGRRTVSNLILETMGKSSKVANISIGTPLVANCRIGGGGEERW